MSDLSKRVVERFAREDYLADRVASIHVAKQRKLGNIPVGHTVEQGTVRIHRYRDHYAIWDLTNAGKRGKKVTRLNLVPSYHASMEADVMLENWAKTLGHMTSFNEITRLFSDILHDYPNDFKMDTYEERGVDVMPAGFTPITVKGDHVEVRVELKDFAVVNTDDQNNLPTCIPAMKGGIKEIPVFYRWVRDNQSQIKSMTFRDVQKQMEALGLKYHEYCAID